MPPGREQTPCTGMGLPRSALFERQSQRSKRRPHQGRKSPTHLPLTFHKRYSRRAASVVEMALRKVKPTDRPPSLPDGWAVMNVCDLGIKGSYPINLKIRKVARTQNLAASWLPAPEEDHRPEQGRVGKSGKRDPLRASMGTPDPYEAAKRAVKWVQDLQRSSRAAKEQEAERRNHVLEAYWKRWYERESTKRKNQRNFARWSRDTRLKWEGASYGIKHQPWAKKSVDAITAADFADYWAVLDARRSPSNDMGGTKAQQKTLIRELLKEARSDFPHLTIPDFPSISRQTKQARHLKREEWNRLISKIVELSAGAAREELTQQQYTSLEWKSSNRLNQRNWVDLYDTLNLMWFFYLRAEDLPRLRSEWFQDHGEEVICFLEQTKGNRPKQRTTHYRPDAVLNWRRMKKRRPAGFLVFPHINRTKSDVAGTLKKNLNELLRHALEHCEPPIPSDGITMTNIRHTAFRLTLEEVPELGKPPGIYAFAKNGMTSAEMLHSTYLRFIEEEETAKTARTKIKPSEWSMIRRVGAT